MALSNEDNPVADKPRKAVKPAVERDAPVAPAPAVSLARAAESSNPLVHQLLALRYSASDPAALARVDAELAALGYTV